MKRFPGISFYNLFGLVIALLITTWLFFSRMDQDALKLHLDIQQRAAVMEAVALRELVQAEVTGENFQENTLQASLEGWSRQWADNARIQIVTISGAKLLAATQPDKGEMFPRKLNMDEKDLFDQAKRLITASLVNKEEEKSRKPEIETAWLSSERVSIAVPINKYEKSFGMLLLEKDVQPFQNLASYSEAFGPLAAGMILFLAGALFFGGWSGKRDREGFKGFFIPRENGFSYGQIAMALAVLIGTAFIWKTHLNKAFNMRLSQEIEQLSQAWDKASILFEKQSTDSQPGNLILDLDPFQNDRAFLSPTGKVSVSKQEDMREKLDSDQQSSFRGFTIFGMIIALFFASGMARRGVLTFTENRNAYFYIFPAMAAMLILVFFPFLFGISLSFTDSNIYNSNLPLSDIWVGMSNYSKILSDFTIFTQAADGTTLINYESFYWTLFITVMWTVCNVTIGVSVGLILALILNTKNLKMRTLYRVLLILPWAIPNYITALIWGGMFHKQFGVINQVLQMVGIEPVAWFDGVFSSFITGIATNSWLSFPFMMVMCLGGLQSISSDMYEAAKLDGATRFQQFRFVTLPSLKIVLVPAIIISVVWTFNMFNIIFLVSGGQPGGANEILITKAYKIAFEQYQYGYAAAYSTVIFAILLIYGVFQMKMTKATEANT